MILAGVPAAMMILLIMANNNSTLVGRYVANDVYNVGDE